MQTIKLGLLGFGTIGTGVVRVLQQNRTLLAERLDALKQPVEVYLFSSASTSNLHFSPLPKIESSLNTFAGRSAAFSWQRVGVHRPGLAERRLAERFGLKLELLQRDRTGLEEGVLVVSMGGRFKSIPLSTIVTADVQGQRIRFKGIRLEAEIASALSFLNDPVSLTLCVSGGHGEHSITDPGPLGLSRLMTSFRATGWNVRELSPLVSPIPAKCQLLLIAGPTKEFLPSEVEAVESWLLQQRGVIVTMDESGEFPGRLREMLGRWNIFPASERLLDAKMSVGKSGGWLWASLVKGSLEDKNWRVVVEGPREIEAREGVQALIESSDKVRRVSPSALSQRALGRQRSGKALIGVINTESTPGRLAVLGFTLGLLNRSLDKRGESSDSSVELIRYLAAWGARRNTEVAIPEVAVIHHHLQLKSSHINSLQLFAMLLLPLIALSIGIWVGFKRRK